MTTTTTAIPITVGPAAAARVKELGMQREFEAMLEHLKKIGPALQAIKVELDHQVNMWNEASVILWTHLTEPGSGEDPADRHWGHWFISNFRSEERRVGKECRL